MGASSQTVKLDVELSPAANTILEEVAAHQRLTMSEVLARAIGLIKVADDAKKANRKLVVADHGVTGVTEIVGL